MTHEKIDKEKVLIEYGQHITTSIRNNYQVFGDHMTAPNNLILYCGKAGKVPEDLNECII